MDSLKELIGLAIIVANERKEDITTSKGNVATTDVNNMIQLEKAILNTFGVGAKDIIKSGNLEVILDTAVVMLTNPES